MKFVAHGNRFASVWQTVSLELDVAKSIVVLKGPFYSRELALDNISKFQIGPDDGMNHGYINWMVTGNAQSADGVRLNTGGKAHLDIRTKDRRRYVIVLDNMEQTQSAAEALRDAGVAWAR